MTARSGIVAAYAAHTRDLLFESVTYKAAPVEPTRSTRKVGLEADGAEISGVFDDIITEAGIVGGQWRMARIQKEIVNFTDLSMDSCWKQVGFVGETLIRNGTWSFEFQSLAELLSQQIGDLTSPIDRRRRLSELGIDIAAFTHAATVTAVTNRMEFTTGVVQTDDYFRYGLAVWLTGANAGLEMEIKDNTGALIELQLPMRSSIVIGDTLQLIRGYDGTRDSAKLLGAEVVYGMQAEPDLPGLRKVLTYPQV